MKIIKKIKHVLNKKRREELEWILEEERAELKRLEDQLKELEEKYNNALNDEWYDDYVLDLFTIDKVKRIDILNEAVIGARISVIKKRERCNLILNELNEMD